jgi:hypothetical protein
MSGLTRRVGITVSCAIVGLLALGTAAQAISMDITVVNHSGQTLRVASYQMDHGTHPDAGQTQLLDNGTLKWYAASEPYAGVEGSLDLATLGTNEGHFHFYFDDPFIGSNSYNTSADGPFAIYRWGSGNGEGNDVQIGYEIVRVRQQFPRVAVRTDGPGQISGQVRWRAAEGLPTGVQPWQALRLTAFMPQTFQAMDPDFVSVYADLTTYNGQRGTFSDLEPAGYFQARPAQSLPAGYFGFDYTISSLGTNLPVQLFAGVVDNVSWPAAPGNDPPVGTIYPKYVRGVVSTAAFFTLWPDAPVRAGVDLEVAGAWVSAPPGGAGPGGMGADLTALIARSKSVAINPNPVLNARLVPGEVLQRVDTRQLENVRRVLTQPVDRTAAPQLENGQVKQYSR